MINIFDMGLTDILDTAANNDNIEEYLDKFSTRRDFILWAELIAGLHESITNIEIDISRDTDNGSSNSISSDLSLKDSIQGLYAAIELAKSGHEEKASTLINRSLSAFSDSDYELFVFAIRGTNSSFVKTTIIKKVFPEIFDKGNEHAKL